MRRLRDLFGDHPADLRQLLHEVGLGLEAAGGVDDAHVEAAFERPGDRPVGHAGRVAAGFTTDQFRPQAFGPRRELLDRGGPKRVAGPEHDAPALLDEAVGELRDGGGLSGAVHTGHQDHRRAGRGHGDSGAGSPQPLEQLTTNRVDDGLGIDHAGPLPFAHVGHDRLGGRRPHVGAHERSPEFFQKRIVHQPPFALQEVAHVGAEHLRGFGEACPEPVEQATALRRRRGLLRVVCLATESEDGHRACLRQSAGVAALRSASSRPRTPATNRAESAVP